MEKLCPFKEKGRILLMRSATRARNMIASTLVDGDFNVTTNAYTGDTGRPVFI